jgi:hypothetical protein
VQREEIKDKLVEVHDTLQRMKIPIVKQFTMQQKNKTQQKPAQKEHEVTLKIMVTGNDTFNVTQKMIRIDEETK